jgi:acyl-CoA thioester hydrolase
MTKKHDPLQPHHIQLRVYYEDTDAEGIVYYANFLRFAERGRTEFLRALGYDHHQVHVEHHLVLVVRHAEIDYRASGKLDDWLNVSTEVIEFRNTSLTMKQIVTRGDTVLAEMKIVIVAISDIGRAARIPPQLRQIFGR